MLKLIRKIQEMELTYRGGLALFDIILWIWFIATLSNNLLYKLIQYISKLN